MYNPYWIPPNCYPYFPYLPQNYFLPERKNGPQFLQSEKKAEEIFPEKSPLYLTRSDLESMNYRIVKRPWSEEEDKKLIELAEVKGCSWNEISHEMGNRNYKMCYSRYKRLKFLSKNKWTEDEDTRLQLLVEKEGMKWKSIVQHFPGRNSKQIRQRYINVLRPNVSKEIWSIQEDLRLVELINHYGKKWKIIQKQMPHRSQNQLKNRYFSKLLKVFQNKKNSHE